MAQPLQQGEVHRADPGRRRLLLRALAGLALAGIACLYLLQSWLSFDMTGISVEDAIMLRRSKWILLGDLCLLLAIVTGGFAFLLLQLARATRAERRWPPAAARTATDVRIRYLSAAEQIARRLQVAGYILGAAALTSAVAGTWRLASLYF